MTVDKILERELTRKDAQRQAAREKSWPEKIATIVRLRDAGHSARRAMQQARKK